MATPPSTPPSSNPKRLLCWQICSYRKPGMSEEDYHTYLSVTHAPILRDIMVKHGVIQWTMNHNTTATRDLLSQFAGPHAQRAMYDCVITATFPDIQTLVALKEDPDFQAKVGPDHVNFADVQRSSMTIGWVEDHVMGGKAV